MDKRKFSEKLGKISSAIVNENRHRLDDGMDLIVICCNRDGYMMSSVNPDRNKRNQVLKSVAVHQSTGGDPELSGDVLLGGKMIFYADD